MVLVGERGAEERHDPVAHHLVDRALVAVDGLHHAFEHGVEQLARLLGIAVGEQLHRALEVGEEHGDLLALAFEGRLRGEDLLGEVLGRVGFGAAERGGAAPLSGAAHWPQNLFSAGLLAPHARHTDASAAAHWPQNLVPEGFSAWHRGQVTPGSPGNRGSEGGTVEPRVSVRGLRRQEASARTGANPRVPQELLVGFRDAP